MFSCCICRAVGSGKRKHRKETFFNRCRHWLNPPPRHRSLLVRVFTKSQGAKVSPPQSDLENTGKVGAWEKFMERMVAAVVEGDQAYISLLVLNYRGFFYIQQVLDRCPTGLVPSMAAEIPSTADLKAPVAPPAMPPADVEPPWPEPLLPTLTIITPAPERETTPMPSALPPPEATSSRDRELKLATSPALPEELAVALMPPQLPPSGPKPVAFPDLAPAASPPETPTEYQEADQVPPAVPSVELQSEPAVAPPEDHCCSSRGH
ncbi:uncharacterized protein LOC143659535 [Tamandua tetradactyla]|uniref:uncharacterized protein LOC143659535 n=1 Tax=Tamandua tetradactyla TaxID=48850 RepID=UPI0040541E67